MTRLIPTHVIRRRAPAVAALLMIPLLAPADSLDIRPGHWEHRVSLESESGRLERQLEQVRQQMEAMPEAQRQMMKDAMEQQGMSFDMEDQTVRDCLTEEEAARGELDWSEESDCDHDIVTDGGETRIEFVCPDDQVEGQLVMDGDSAYSGEATAMMDFGEGSEKVTMSHEGRWLSEDCP